ncbi:alpha/beta fold hydrolase [Bacillus cereus]|nr:alpha/beta hydrolase [Bacillus cereus]EDX59636.1 hydrolase, alpha/beta fold family [Bacillus cereus 03BB108]QKG98854.1 alpha/beta hydrolase [Bacillus cereus]
MKFFNILMLICLIILLLISCKAMGKLEKEKIYENGEEPTIETNLKIEEKMVDIDGQSIYFKQIGEGKPPLLMFHGFGNSSDGFKDIYSDLAKRHSIISVDLLGFGRSSKPINYLYTFPNQANMYYKLMKKLGYDSFAIMGHSMGGELALNLTYLYPNAVTHLILVDAPGVETLQNKIFSPKPSLIDTLNTVTDIREYKENDVKYKRSNTDHYKELRKMIENPISMDPKKIQAPTLIIWGRKDKSVSWKDGRKYQELIKNSTFRVIEDGYHAPFRQEPKEFIKYIEEYFENYPF